MTRSSLAAFAILILSAWFFLAVLDFGFAQAATNVSGIISQNTTWAALNSPYSLTGNLLVAQNITLTINPGVTVNLANYYIKVNGTLNAVGTNTNPVQFNGGSITFTAYSASWNPQDGAGSTIKYANLDSTLLTSEVPINLESDQINAKVTVEIQTTISNCKITANIFGGNLSRNTIVGDVSSPVVQNNVIVGTVTSSGVVSNNQITGGVVAQANVIVASNTIIGNGSGAAIFTTSGLYQTGGYATIESNLITNSEIGIDIGIWIRDWVGTTVPTVQNNIIKNNSIGIEYSISYFDHPHPKPTVIQNNTITENWIGMQFVGGSGGSPTLIGTDDYVLAYNNIYGNTNCNFRLVDITSNVNASLNWWGTAEAQAIEQTIYDYNFDFELGNVLVSPFLAAPYSGTPSISTPMPTAIPTSPANQTPTPTQTISTTPNPTLPPTSPSGPLPTPMSTVPEFQTQLTPLMLIAMLAAATLIIKNKLKPTAKD